MAIDFDPIDAVMRLCCTDTCRRYQQRKIEVGKTSEELELEKIKGMQKAAGEYVQESQRSFKKLITIQQTAGDLKEDSEAREMGEQKRIKRRRVC